MEHIEDRVQEAPVPFAVAGVDLDGMPVEVVELIQSVVLADRRRMIAEHFEEIKRLEAGAEERELQLRRQNEELQQHIKECEAVISQQELEIKDLTEKRDAAVAQYEEAQKEKHQLEEKIKDLETHIDVLQEEAFSYVREIERLNNQIDDYQKAKVWGERQAQNIIDVNEVEQEEIQRRVEAVRKLYVSRDDTYGTMSILYDEQGNKHVVPRSQADEQWAPIEAPALVGGESFRTEDPSADAGNGGISDTEEAVGFQAPEAPVLSGADHHTANGTMDDAPVTRAEFEELKARVDRLEQQQAGAAA